MNYKKIFFFLSIFYLVSFPSFSENLNDRYFACGIKSVFNKLNLPSSYEDYLNDKNKYYHFTEKLVYYDWNWKEGKFLSKADVTENNEDYIQGRVFYKFDNKKDTYVRAIRLNKYSLKLQTFLISLKLLDKDKDLDKAEDRHSLDCIKIDSSNLFKLKNRF